MSLVRKKRRWIAPQAAVPGSMPGANGALGAVLNVGAKPRQLNAFPHVLNPSPRPPGNPTGKGYITG